MRPTRVEREAQERVRAEAEARDRAERADALAEGRHAMNQALRAPRANQTRMSVADAPEDAEARRQRRLGIEKDEPAGPDPQASEAMNEALRANLFGKREARFGRSGDDA